MVSLAKAIKIAYQGCALCNVMDSENKHFHNLQSWYIYLKVDLHDKYTKSRVRKSRPLLLLKEGYKNCRGNANLWKENLYRKSYFSWIFVGIQATHLRPSQITISPSAIPQLMVCGPVRRIRTMAGTRACGMGTIMGLWCDFYHFIAILPNSTKFSQIREQASDHRWNVWTAGRILVGAAIKSQQMVAFYHLGQCRLDRDSICIALGGICVHGACCTTPFAGVMVTSTSPRPSIEGEVPRLKC